MILITSSAGTSIFFFENHLKANIQSQVWQYITCDVLIKKNKIFLFFNQF